MEQPAEFALSAEHQAAKALLLTIRRAPRQPAHDVIR
jgi:hypothetical protein